MAGFTTPQVPTGTITSDINPDPNPVPTNAPTSTLSLTPQKNYQRESTSDNRNTPVTATDMTSETASPSFPSFLHEPSAPFKLAPFEPTINILHDPTEENTTNIVRQ